MHIDIERILLELESLPEYDTQIMLQYAGDNKDPFYGTGNLKDTKYWEYEYCNFLFKQLTYTNMLIDKFNMVRTRVMRMHPKTCYTYHKDHTKRLHIPLITNENCMFIIDDKIHRYPADGNYYVVDTTKKHTAVNASFEERIHIVGCLHE